MHRYKLMLAGLLLACACTNLFAAEKPNIIIILTDDANYHSFSYTGCKRITTPNIDRIFKEGVFCTDVYATFSVCAPSRAGMMTGRYQTRFSYETLTGNTEKALAADRGVDLREIMLSDVLQKAGYRTGMIGKWHLGASDKFQPPARGFDYSYSFRGGCGGYYGWEDLLENGKPVKGEGYTIPPQTDAAIGFIERNKDRPFFMYWASPLVHSPHIVDPEFLPEGATQNKAPGKPHLEPEDKREEAMKVWNNVYDGMINALDAQVGRVLDKLDELGIAENTIIVFTNDNGGGKQRGNPPFTGTKGQFHEGALRMPFAVRWPAQIPAGTVYDKSIISLMDLFPTLIEVGGGTMPTDREIDGINILPYLTGKAVGDPNRAHYWRANTGYFIRKGKWKMHWKVDNAEAAKRYLEIHGHKKGREDRPLYDISLAREVWLYDLSKDIKEENNIAEQFPEVVKELQQELIGFSKIRENDPLYKNDPHDPGCVECKKKP